MAGQDYTSAFAQLSGGPGMLQQAQEALALQGHHVQVQAAQQQLMAREAMGPILQGAINKETGELDYNKAFVGMAANPATAWMAPEFLDKAVARQGTQAETAIKELEKNMKQQTSIYDAVAGLLPKGSALGRSDMIAAAADLYNSGVIDKGHFTNFVAQLPQDGAPMLGFAKQLALRSQGAAKSLETVYKGLTTIDTGGAEVLVQPQPLEGGARVVGTIPKTMAPAQAEELVEAIDVSGKFGTPGATVKAPRSQLFSSGQSAAPAGQKGAGEPSTPGAPPQSPPIIVTGRAPQEVEALKKMGDQYKEVSDLAQTNVTFGLALDKAENLLKRYQPGAGADVRERIATGLSALGIDNDIVDKVANGSLPAGQVFKSVMLDLATARMKKALEGGGRFTNIEFTTYNTTKPNPNMSPQAVRELIQYYRKTIKLEQAYVKGYMHYVDPRSGKNPLDFQNWWSGVIDKVQKAENAQ